jgi:FMN phosphatase YigB (HAD superfamily)
VDQRFIDDSLLNVRGAIAFGWKRKACVLLDEDGEEGTNIKEGEDIVVIKDLEGE